MPTRYFLHAPRSTTVFSTTNPSISRFLRRQHVWASFESECIGIPDHVTTSCIRELENGEIAIDQEVLDGEQIAENYRGLLWQDGFVEPDLRYVGRLVRLKEGSSARTEDGSGGEAER
jgi:hypothetical protein